MTISRGRGPIAAMDELDHKPRLRGLFHRRSHDSDTDFGDHTPLPAELPDDDPFLDEPEDAAPRETAAGEPSAAPSRSSPTSQVPLRPRAVRRRRCRSPRDAEPGHTVEYDVEKAFAEEDGSDEDILEETPEFLADTPDHDRLWFEQKPPPDFDFDR